MMPRMAYTLWHAGVLMGETDFEQNGGHPGQRAGVFRPTAYGRKVLPLVSGLLTAAADLKHELETRGMSEDDMSSEDVEDIFKITTAGQKVIDIGRNLADVQLRDASGTVLAFSSIAFIDVGELAHLMDRLGCCSEEQRDAVDDEHAPEFIVSATIRGPCLADAVRRGQPVLPARN
jgi:hypothetical protein